MRIKDYQPTQAELDSCKEADSLRIAICNKIEEKHRQKKVNTSAKEDAKNAKTAKKLTKKEKLSIYQ
jgi:isopropylmalate/homocitrate/citramalate synthase